VVIPSFEAYAAAARVSDTLVRPSAAPAQAELLRAAADEGEKPDELLRASDRQHPGGEM
jgi:hypothetical protein